MKCILEGQLPDLSGKVDSIGGITQEQFDSLNYDHTMFGSIGPWITGHPQGNDFGIILLGAYSVDTNHANGMQDITYTNGDRYYRKAVNGTVSEWFKVATNVDLSKKTNVGDVLPMVASLTTPAAGLDANNFVVGKMYCTNSAAESATVANRPLEAQKVSLSSSAIFMIPTNTSNNNYCVQFWIARWQLRMFFRYKDPGTEGSWGSWKEISMNTTPVVQTIPLSEGITTIRSAIFWRNNVGEVTISAVLRGDIKNKDIIGTLPIGYRPSVAITIPCGTEIGKAREVVSALDINLDGSLVYWGPTLSGTLGDNIYFSGSFPAIDI